MMLLDLYSDKGNLGTIYTSRKDAQSAMTAWLKECFEFGGDPNNMPKLVEFKKKIGGQTFEFWMLVHS